MYILGCEFDGHVVSFPEHDSDTTDFVVEAKNLDRPNDDYDDDRVGSMNDGVLDYVKDIVFLFVEEEGDGPSIPYELTSVKTLLDNTARKIGSIRIDVEWETPIPLSQEYLDFFESVCRKAERLRFFSIPGQEEMDILANCIATQQDDSFKGLSLFANPGIYTAHHLRQIFQTTSLKKLILQDVDLTDENLGSGLIASLESNCTSLLRTLDIAFCCGHDDVLLKRVFCAVVDHTQVEDLRLSSRTRHSTHMDEGQEDDNFNEATRRSLEALASAKYLRILVIGSLLPRRDGAYLKSFADAICRNRYLEKLAINKWEKDESGVGLVWKNQGHKKIYHHLCMNRATRQLDHGSTPAALWPYILERAGKILYWDDNDIRKSSPSSESPRADVIFELLRGGVADGITI